jgi:uncharacterized YccA/Bax inhibitor family protein
MAAPSSPASRPVRRAERRSSAAGVALSVVGVFAVAAWALAHATAELAPATALVGISGICIFTAALVGKRKRTTASGLFLAGAAAVIGALHQAASTRAGVLAVSGAVLFCAAEIADRSLDQMRIVAHRRGVVRWSPAWVLGVAAGSAGVSFGADSMRGLFTAGGPAALAAGTAAAMLVAILASAALRARARAGP